MPKNRYLSLAQQLKDASDNVSDVEIESICDELDELWDSFSDDDKDELNAIDNDDY
jgi:hypothetical protein